MVLISMVFLIYVFQVLYDKKKEKKIKSHRPPSPQKS